MSRRCTPGRVDHEGGDGIYRAAIPESWIVYAVWPLAAIALALVVVRRRDV